MISKTDLLDYRQCTRKIWLKKMRPDLVPETDSSLERRAMDGHLVNKAAREALGPDFLWPETKDSPEETMQAALKQLAENPTRPVVELPLFHDGLYARLDALLPSEEGFLIEETKSSTFPLKSNKVDPGKPEPHHLDDVAIQAWVAKSAGLPVDRLSLNLLDSRWTYLGEGDYSGLFRQYHVEELVEDLLPEVPLWLKDVKELLNGPMPEVTTGGQCKKPHECPFKEFCQSLEPAPEPHPVELLPDLAGKNLARTLRGEFGYTSLLDVPDDQLVGKDRELYLRIKHAHAQNAPVMLPGIAQELENLPYPRYFFDFEGIDLPVPRWAGVRPYEQIPFQWSCHVEREPGKFEHYAFLDVTGEDPSLACIERMREVIDESDNGPIIVYYQTYEKCRMIELAERHPEFLELMETYIRRLYDLHPVVKRNYYHPDMKGSFSIKKVLPTIAPDMNYEDLEEVQEGTGAQIAYLHAAFSPLGKRTRYRLAHNMLAYCEQDTWAMVVVFAHLARQARPELPASDLNPLKALEYRATQKEMVEQANAELEAVVKKAFLKEEVVE